MKQFIVRKWIFVFISIAFVACMRTDSKKQFEVSGTIANSTAKMVYLEEVPAGSTQGTIVDSSVIDKNGQYKLKADTKEPLIYNLRLDQNSFPIAAVINDVPKMTLNVELSKGSNQFADKYEVKGSPVSQEMKDFMYAFNDYVQEMFPLAVRADSLRKNAAPDSAFDEVKKEWKVIADKTKAFSLNSLTKTNNPALYIFELGYYQGTAERQAFNLEPIQIEEEIRMLSDAIKKFPGHHGLVEVKNLKEADLARYNEENKSQWMGKPAPDFSLPDVNGNPVALSSFKGKYVLVDFWASWCAPCRAENPSVVKAYNKFKGKNFTVLGVSLDRPDGKDEWLKAIKSDNLTWTHVSELKYWDSSVVPLYGFNGIPYNVLVDPTGVVIAENVKGQTLETKLNEVLK